MAIKEKKSLSLIASYKSITFDEGQIYVSKYLDNLLAKINNLKKDNFLHKIFSKNKSNEIIGIYLYGGVGRGKSMMMDLFFHQVQIKDKRRLHFHDFIKET